MSSLTLLSRTSTPLIAPRTLVRLTVLRREKKMKDKDGKPIVSLPDKKIEIVHLDFSKEEREIYEALYRNAKSKFLGYAETGTVLQYAHSFSRCRGLELTKIELV